MRTPENLKEARAAATRAGYAASVPLAEVIADQHRAIAALVAEVTRYRRQTPPNPNQHPT